MITSVNKDGITILTPSKGMWLTKDGAYSQGNVYLGKTDKAENWIEQAEGPPEPVMPLPPDEELPIVKAELEDTKTALAKLGVKKLTTWTAAAEKLEPIAKV